MQSLCAVELIEISSVCADIRLMPSGQWYRGSGRLKNAWQAALNCDFLCSLCGREFIYCTPLSARSIAFYTACSRRSSIDHILPLAKGGSNALSNMQLACAKCNSIRGTRSIEEYRPHVEKTFGQLVSDIENLAEEIDLCPVRTLYPLREQLKAAKFWLPEAEQLKIQHRLTPELIKFCNVSINRYSATVAAARKI